MIQQGVVHIAEEEICWLVRLFRDIFYTIYPGRGGFSFMEISFLLPRKSRGSRCRNAGPAWAMHGGR